MSGKPFTVIIGGGPAGLTAAYELLRHDLPSLVLEADALVGGISRTDVFKGYRFDIGGHRFFTKVEVVQRIWQEIIGDDFLVRPRLSRIFYEDKFFDYPLRPVNALLGLGPVEAVRIGLSWVRAQLFPSAEERSFEQWVVNRFGRRLFEIFFKTYTEKVWGMSCTEIGADFAAQRIKNLDLGAALRNMLLGSGRRKGEVITTLIDQFHYPRLGPGMMWERCRERLEKAGTETRLRTRVVSLRHDGRAVRSVVTRDADGREEEIAADEFISSMPVRELVRALDPAPPAEVLEAASKLRYRDFVTVGLVVDRADAFPDNWIYIHSPKVKMGRIQNFKNWSPEMVPDPSKTFLGLEYFVNEGDEVWSAPDAELVDLGRRECELLGLVRPGETIDGCVIRMPKAYPVYDGVYKDALATIRRFLERIENLQLVGRNGQHRYNNQDHSMLTAVYAAQNIAGQQHDVWDVNVDGEYHEEVRTSAAAPHGDRLVPQPVVAPDAAELLRTTFARYDPVALGCAIGALCGGGLFLATAILLLRGGPRVGENLKLLGNYLALFDVSWQGAFVGLLEAGAGGFVFGVALAFVINAVVRFEEVRLLRHLELESALDPLEGEG
jgi:protoporphyrinogen oxidase